MPKTAMRARSCIDRFSNREKVLWRFLYAEILLTGVWAVYLSTPLGALFYFGMAVVGLGMMMLWCLCANCPYPYHFDTCLFLPPRWIRTMLKYRGGEMSVLDKTGFAAAFTLLLVIPQYWLIRHPWLLGLFWAGGLPMLIVFPVRYCRRCRHGGCPFNRLSSNAH